MTDPDTCEREWETTASEHEGTRHSLDQRCLECRTTRITPWEPCDCQDENYEYDYREEGRE